MCVDGRLLLDAGAPLLTHLHRLGIDPGGIETIFLTHFHADHTLGLAPFVLHRLFRDKRPFTAPYPLLFSGSFCLMMSASIVTPRWFAWPVRSADTSQSMAALNAELRR